MKNLKKFLITNFVLFLLSFNTFAELEIRNLVPPKLSTTNIGDSILCHRPVRHGTPQMNIQSIGTHVIANNYGHGGSGWTLAPGSAKYVNDLLINSEYSLDLKKDTPITIVGAGALGLFSAYDLISRGFSNITIVAKEFTNLTSHKAGGLLAPVSMDNAPEFQDIVTQIGLDAYKFYASIAQKTNIHFSKGALIIPAYFKTREESGLEPYVNKVMQPAKDVVLDFGNGTRRTMVAYDDGIFIDTVEMMKSLTDFLVANNVSFVKQQINVFSDIKGKFIVNCTGIGAEKLSNDKAMFSVQGHLIMLKDQKPEDLNYMLLVYLDESQNENNQKVKRSFYIFPKKSNTGLNDIGVIGGTFIEGADDSTPNTKEFEIVVKNAKEFYGIR